MNKVDPILYERINQSIEAMGYDFFGCEILSEGGDATFRVFIDKPQGVTIEDCTAASHQLSALLDVLDPMQGEYRLEVSSPSVDRPLFKIEHFQKYIGKQIKIQLYPDATERRRYKGVLLRVEGEAVYLLVHGIENEIKLPFSRIEKANLIGELCLTK